MFKRKKPEVHLYRVWQGHNVDDNELIYADSPREAFLAYLKEHDVLLMDFEASINVTDLGLLKDPDDRD